MKVTIILIGKTEEVYLEEGIQKYLARLKHYVKVEWKVIAPVKQAAVLPVEELKKREGELILSNFNIKDFNILLDESGDKLSSKQFADFIIQKKNSGVSSFTFIIGGAYGVSDEIKSRVHYQLSLSQMTFTHQMARLILAEQIYRAISIEKGSKYHH